MTAGLNVLLLYLSLSRDNAENMHFFSSLALTLNEPEEGVAPTDSRLRPDQRLMEAGLWDEANIQKQRLEECQRLERKRREAQANQALEEGETKETKKSCDPVCFSEGYRLQQLELSQSLLHHKNVNSVCVTTLTASGDRPVVQACIQLLCPLRILEEVFLNYLSKIKIQQQRVGLCILPVLFKLETSYLALSLFCF